MPYLPLRALLDQLKAHTKLHIGIHFFSEPSQELLVLPHEYEIHSAPICDYAKATDGGYAKCRACHSHFMEQALTTKEAFFSICAHGVLEYTHPVLMEGRPICILFLSNQLEKDAIPGKLQRIFAKNPSLRESMEGEVSRAECESIGAVIESYLRLLCASIPNLFSAPHRLSERVMQVIDANLEYQTDVKSLAALFHYNEKYLGRIFLAQTGETISAYRNRRRLLLAQDYLRDCEDSIATIAERVGFENVAYFNRLFRRTTGFSPTEFRRKFQKKEKLPL